MIKSRHKPALNLPNAWARFTHAFRKYRNISLSIKDLTTSITEALKDIAIT